MRFPPTVHLNCTLTVSKRGSHSVLHYPSALRQASRQQPLHLVLQLSPQSECHSVSLLGPYLSKNISMFPRHLIPNSPWSRTHIAPSSRGLRKYFSNISFAAFSVASLDTSILGSSRLRCFKSVPTSIRNWSYLVNTAMTGTSKVIHCVTNSHQCP